MIVEPGDSSIRANEGSATRLDGDTSLNALSGSIIPERYQQ
jgi:hypothetical protein